MTTDNTKPAAAAEAPKTDAPAPGTGGAVDLIFYGLILMIICIFRPNGLISFVPKDILERKKQR